MGANPSLRSGPWSRVKAHEELHPICMGRGANTPVPTQETHHEETHRARLHRADGRLIARIDRLRATTYAVDPAGPQCSIDGDAPGHDPGLLDVHADDG